MVNNGKRISDAAHAIEIDRKAFGRKVKQYNLPCSATAEKRGWRKKSESQRRSKKLSNVQVKDEPVNVETDSETEHDDIEVDKLQPLDPKCATLTKFPIRSGTICASLQSQRNVFKLRVHMLKKPTFTLKIVNKSTKSNPKQLRTKPLSTKTDLSMELIVQ